MWGLQAKRLTGALQFSGAHRAQIFPRAERRLAARTCLAASKGQNVDAHASLRQQSQRSPTAKRLIVWMGKEGQ